MRGTMLTLAAVAAVLTAATTAAAQPAPMIGAWRMQGPNGSMVVTLEPGGARYVGETNDGGREEDTQAMRYEERADGTVVMTELNADGSTGEAATAVMTGPDTLVITRQGGQRMEFRREAGGAATPASK